MPHKKNLVTKSLLIAVLLSGCYNAQTSRHEQKENQNLLIHDFGIIRPQSEHTHTFYLENNTEHDWHVSEIEKSCSCTAIKLSSDIVPAKGSTEIEMTYRAGKEMADEKRDSSVVFEETNISPIILRIKAQIRPEMYISPRNIAITAYRPDKNYSSTIKVHDWTDKGIVSMDFLPDEPWVTASDCKKSRAIDTSSPFSAWEGEININSKTLMFGRNYGRIKIVARDRHNEYSTFVDLVVTVSSIAKIIPSNLFFGDVDRGKTTTLQCVLLMVPQEQTGLHDDPWEALVIEKELPDDVLKIQLAKESQTKGLLTFSLTPASSGKLAGDVKIKFKKGQFHELRLPVIAHLRDCQTNL